MKSLEELNAIKEKYKSDVAIRTSDYEIRIIVGMGNSGIANGARDTLKALTQMVEEEGLSGKVIVTQAARISKAGLNPVVEVVENGAETLYSHITAEKAKTIIKQHIIGGQIVEDYLLTAEETQEV